MVIPPLNQLTAHYLLWTKWSSHIEVKPPSLVLIFLTKSQGAADIFGPPHGKVDVTVFHQRKNRMTFLFKPLIHLKKSGKFVD